MKPKNKFRLNMLRWNWRHPRHLIHYWWNNSRLNKNYEPFVSSCRCCCIWCEDDA